jgi:hypothetical protein
MECVTISGGEVRSKDESDLRIFIEGLPIADAGQRIGGSVNKNMRLFKMIPYTFTSANDRPRSSTPTQTPNP